MPANESERRRGGGEGDCHANIRENSGAYALVFGGMENLKQK